MSRALTAEAVRRMRRAVRNAHALGGGGCACPMPAGCREAGLCLIAQHRAVDRCRTTVVTLRGDALDRGHVKALMEQLGATEDPCKG